MKKYVEDLDFQGEEYLNEWTPWSPQDIRRKKGVLEAARMMVNSAHTAPFAGGFRPWKLTLSMGRRNLKQSHAKWRNSPMRRIAGKSRFCMKQ